MSKSTPKELADGLANLSLSQNPGLKTPIKKKKKKAPVAESWDDEEISDNDEAETPEKVPSPPPPTPTTPHALGHTRNSSSVSSIATPRSPRDSYIGPETFSRDSSVGGERGERPTTTDAVARRMISAALGVRTRSTKEQREYDSAVRMAEKRKKDDEKERKRLEEQEKERMKTAIWED